VAQPTGVGAQRARVPSKTLGIFCHKSLEFQVSHTGAVQKDGFCWKATHQKSQLHSGNGNCMRGQYVQFIQCWVRSPKQRHSRRIRASFVSDVWPKQLS